MSIDEHEAEQLREIINQREIVHKNELKEKDEQISELQNSLKVRTRVHLATDAEFNAGYFTGFVTRVLNMIDPTKRIGGIYLENMSLVNYAFVCGCGVILNMIIIHQLVIRMPLVFANSIAILVAFISNYTFTVGPLGYLFGLSPRHRPKEVVQ